MFRPVESLLAGIFASIFAVTALTSAAHAVSITNRDDKEYKLTIIEEDGAKKADHQLKANQLLENVCLKGCIIRIDDSEADEYELIEGNEIVSIEDGQLYYDQDEAQPAPGAPESSPASGQRKL